MSPCPDCGQRMKPGPLGRVSSAGTDAYAFGDFHCPVCLLAVASVTLNGKTGRAIYRAPSGEGWTVTRYRQAGSVEESG